MSISNKFDCFNCYMAGLIKAEKAVAVALRVAANTPARQSKKDTGNTKLERGVYLFHAFAGTKARLVGGLRPMSHCRGASPSLHKHIPIRDPGKAGPTLFAFPPGCSSAKDMYELGRAQWTRMRAIVTSRDSSFMRCRLVFISECVCII